MHGLQKNKIKQAAFLNTLVDNLGLSSKGKRRLYVILTFGNRLCWVAQAGFKIVVLLVLCENCKGLECGVLLLVGKCESF